MSQMCPNCSLDNLDEAKSCSKCSTPLRQLQGQNTLLSQRYRLLSVLGCGAMGAVYLADDQRLNGRRCAIKENRPDPVASPKAQAQARDQFLAEASVLARLDHPNLPKVSDYFIENGREYLVMDYVAGDDLESRMTATNRPLPETEVIGWADQVLDALAYLHNQKPQPIIHRDIKPANLRVDLYNRIKLVDFGLVKLFDANSPETKAELRGIGTPAYAPLEQFAGSDEHTDPRSDIYSFGATLYHLLTNVPPVEVHRRLLKPESLPAPRGLNSNLSEHIQTVIQRAIAIYPDERYQTAEEMRRALLSANQPPAAAKAKKSARSSSPVIFGLIGLLLVIGLLGGIAYLLLNNQNQAVTLATPSTQIDSDTPMPLNNAPVLATDTPTSTPTQAATEIAPTATPTVPPTDTPTPTDTPSTDESLAAQPGRGIPGASLVGQIAYPVFNGTSYDLYLGQADGSGVRLLQPQASQPAFSPDGRRLTYHSWNLAQRGLMAMNAGGGGALLLTTFAEDQLPTWNPDNTITLLSRRSGSRKSELYQVSSTVEQGQATLLGEGEYPTAGAVGLLVFKGWGNSGVGLRVASTNFDNVQPLTDHEDDTAPALSPDGAQVAFMSRRSGNWDIYVVDIDGQNLRQLTTDPAQDGLPAWSPDGQVVAFVSDRNEQWAVWATTPAGDEAQQLFTMAGSPDGFVGADSFASRGWAEERISWSQ